MSKSPRCVRGGHPWVPLAKRLLASCIALMVSTTAARAGVPATPPPAVSFCDLLSNPKAFDGQWIQVHGRISLAFEDFTLWEQGCDRPLARSVWLEYGGDEETPTKFCCGDHSRPKGKDISIRGQTVPLIRDAQMKEFIQKVRDQRSRKANGQACQGSLCNLYHLSATLTGLFPCGARRSQWRIERLRPSRLLPLIGDLPRVGRCRRAYCGSARQRELHLHYTDMAG